MATPYLLFANSEYTDYQIEIQHIYCDILISQNAKVGAGGTVNHVVTHYTALVPKFPDGGRSWWRQRFQSFHDFSAGGNQIGNQPFVDIQVALVLAEVADIVALGQYAPDFRTKAERVR